MAGAIAGTALVNYAPSVSDELSTVTLTINNVCNLSCPHCYLQYAGDDSGYIGEATLDKLFQTKFKHLVVVGKEPFVNRHSVAILEDIVSRVTDQGRTVGVITNGLGLHRITERLAHDLSYIDVSFDGGPRSYELYRKGNYASLISNLRNVRDNHGFNRFNALHVVNDRTIPFLDDMLSVEEIVPFNAIMFSPYIETKNHGKNYVKRLRIQNVLEAFANNPAFMSSKVAFILLDIYHLLGEDYSRLKSPHLAQIDFSEIRKAIAVLGLDEKVRVIDKDPIRHGFVRLTYDGFLLSPYASLNPAEYRVNGDRVSSSSIPEFFRHQLSLNLA